MVSCSQCVRNNDVCYYDRRQSVSCSECLRNNRVCDGTFALEEFRKVGEQKKQFEASSRAKRRKIQLLRRNLVELTKELADAEEQDNDIQESIAQLDVIASRMLQREMQALGVFEQVAATGGSEQEVAFADPNFAWAEAPQIETMDWDKILRGSLEQIPA